MNRATPAYDSLAENPKPTASTHLGALQPRRALASIQTETIMAASCIHCGCKIHDHNDHGCTLPYHKCKASPGINREAFISRPTKPQSHFAEARDEWSTQ